MRNSTMQVTLVGAEEAHLLAKEIAAAGVGVVLVPVRPLPLTWASRRMYAFRLFTLISSLTCTTHSLPGPPMTEETSVGKLVKHDVTVGIGVVGAWEARNARFDAAWVTRSIHHACSTVTYSHDRRLSTSHLLPKPKRLHSFRPTSASYSVSRLGRGTRIWLRSRVETCLNYQAK